MNGVIYEHFLSVNGEVNPFYQGQFQHFIRFGGCNMACSYCDTKDALAPECGKQTIWEVLKDLEKEYPRNGKCPVFNITGGEPFYHLDQLIKLVNEIHKSFSNPAVIVKSNGTYDIDRLIMKCPDLGDNLMFALDYKLDAPASKPFCMDNFRHLRKNDVLNIPVWNRSSFESATQLLTMYAGMGGVCQLCLSPIMVGRALKGENKEKKFDASILSKWMIEKSLYLLGVRLNIQLHKAAGLR